jgi:hypothetical protein
LLPSEEWHEGEDTGVGRFPEGERSQAVVTPAQRADDTVGGTTLDDSFTAVKRYTGRVLMRWRRCRAADVNVNWPRRDDSACRPAIRRLVRPAQAMNQR